METYLHRLKHGTFKLQDTGKGKIGLKLTLNKNCRRMVDSEETHYKLAGEQGGVEAGFREACKVKCARVYHLNLVLRVKTRNLPHRTTDVRDTNKLMHMERARLILNKQGILRLQPLGILSFSIKTMHECT